MRRFGSRRAGTVEKGRYGGKEGGREGGKEGGKRMPALKALKMRSMRQEHPP
jgi:hypothetical protein